MIADTRLLLGLRLQITWNGFRSRSLARKLLLIGVAIWIGASVVVASGAIGYGAGALLDQFPHAGLDSLLPGAILAAVMIILLLSSFGMALGSLFLSSDLDLLMTAPVDRRAVFLSKLLDGMGVNYLIVLIAAGPALLAYGLSLGYGPAYYILAILALVAAPLLPEGLGALLVMLVARFAPARRVREVLGLAAALFGISCSLIGQTSRLWVGNFTGTTRPDLEALRAQVTEIANLPLPPLLAGRGLAAAGIGAWGAAAVPTVAFLALTLGFFAGCVWLANSWYAAGWVRMQSAGSAKRSRARAERAAASSGLLGRAPATLALALKDWRVIPRDLRNFAQVLGPLVLIPVVYINLLGGRGQGFNALEAANQWAAGRVDPTSVFLAAGILLSSALVVTQISSTAISMEGASWWILKTAPVSPEELALGKFLTAEVPFVVLSSLLIVGAFLWRGFSVLGLLYGWFGILLLGSGMLAMALGFGMRWPRLDWDDPRRMRSGYAMLASFAAEILLGLLGGGLLCLPLVAEVLAPDWVAPAWIVGILGATALTVALAYAVVQIGLQHLPEVGES